MDFLRPLFVTDWFAERAGLQRVLGFLLGHHSVVVQVRAISCEDARKTFVAITRSAVSYTRTVKVDSVRCTGR